MDCPTTPWRRSPTGPISARPPFCSSRPCRRPITGCASSRRPANCHSPVIRRSAVAMSGSVSATRRGKSMSFNNAAPDWCGSSATPRGSLSPRRRCCAPAPSKRTFSSRSQPDCGSAPRISRLRNGSTTDPAGSPCYWHRVPRCWRCSRTMRRSAISNSACSRRGTPPATEPRPHSRCARLSRRAPARIQSPAASTPVWRNG